MRIRGRQHTITSSTMMYTALFMVLAGATVDHVVVAASDRGELGLLTMIPNARSAGRGLLQDQDEGSSDDLGIFSSVQPCEAFVNILTDTPRPDSSIGNFTTAPTEEEMRSCATNNAVYLLNGEALAQALIQPAPLLKVVTMSPAEPIAWPQDLTPAPLFTPGSVILIDCQEQFLDLRAFPVNNVMEDATVIFLRCQVIWSDLTKPLTRIQWNVDSSSILPCDGETAGARVQSKNPRDNPNTFERLQHSFATNHTVHLMNTTIWCWSDQDIADIYAGDEPSEISGDGVESWVPWVAGIGAAVILGGVLVGVCVCCGCCARWCGALRGRGGDGAEHHGKHLFHGGGGGFPRDRGPPSHVPSTDRSTEELAEALTAVLKSHRFRTVHHTMTSATASQHSKFFDAPAALRDCPDCGAPHGHPPDGPHRHRRRNSLFAHSDAAQGSERASGSGSRGTESVLCINCAAHVVMDPVAEQHRSISEMHGDAHSNGIELPAARWHRHQVPDHRCAARSSDLSKKSTEAWVEDSLEARAAMSTGMHGPRENDVESASMDDRYSGTSISLAPHRRSATRSGPMTDPRGESHGFHAPGAAPPSDSHPWPFSKVEEDRDASPPRRAPPHGGRLRAPPSGAFSEQSKFYDAPEASSVPPSVSTSNNSSPNLSSPNLSSPNRSNHAAASPPRIMEPLRGMHDATTFTNSGTTGGTKVHWLPPPDGFNSPARSPRQSPKHAGAFASGGGAHPLLQAYQTPPATHPILHPASQKSSHCSHDAGESNDLERAVSRATEEPLINGGGPVSSGPQPGTLT